MNSTLVIPLQHNWISSIGNISKKFDIPLGLMGEAQFIEVELWSGQSFKIQVSSSIFSTITAEIKYFVKYGIYPHEIMGKGIEFEDFYQGSIFKEFIEKLKLNGWIVELEQQ